MVPVWWTNNSMFHVQIEKYNLAAFSFPIDIN